MVTRDIENALREWKTNPDRRPILLRGARQVGKSFVAQQFGRTHFSNLAEANFEFQPELKDAFNSLVPEQIIRSLSLLLNERIVPGETLLFLDEIQLCPQAITALRYFFEKMPALHVIAAGSLLEFVINSEDFNMPVGRIQYLFLGPLSFNEFLDAINESQSREFIEALHLDSTISNAVHEKLLRLLRQYLITGGMPAVVTEYLKGAGTTDYQRMQSTLLQTYRDDFGKYSNVVKHRYLQKVYETAPGMVGKRYKYVEIDREMSSRELKEALLLLSQAGVISKVTATSGKGLPLSLYADDHRFKIIFLDCGLTQRALGMNAKTFLSDDFISLNAGSIAEQFVGQELLVRGAPYLRENLHFWNREKRGSSAEIDFLVAVDSEIVGIEVKSGTTGRLKSLQSFMRENSSSVGVRFSQLPLSLYDKVLSIPLYAVSAMDRLVKEAWGKGH